MPALSIFWFIIKWLYHNQNQPTGCVIVDPFWDGWSCACLIPGCALLYLHGVFMGRCLFVKMNLFVSGSSRIVYVVWVAKLMGSFSHRPHFCWYSIHMNARWWIMSLTHILQLPICGRGSICCQGETMEISGMFFVPCCIPYTESVLQGFQILIISYVASGCERL